MAYLPRRRTGLRQARATNALILPNRTVPATRRAERISREVADAEGKRTRFATAPEASFPYRAWAHLGSVHILSSCRREVAQRPGLQAQMAAPLSLSKKLSRSVSTANVAREPALSSLRGETRATPAALTHRTGALETFELTGLGCSLGVF